MEADKADEMKKALEFKAEIEALKQEKEGLEVKLSEYEESFKKIEEEKLSSLREKVMQLNAEVNGDLTEEEIDSFEEATLNRYVQTFEHIAQHMVKIAEPVKEEKVEQYKVEEKDNVSLADKLTSNLKELRGF